MNKRKSADSDANSCCNVSKRSKTSVIPFKDNVIRYSSMPSLEHLAAVKLVIPLFRPKWKVILACIQSKRKRVKSKRLDLRLVIKKEISKLSGFDVIRKILSDLVAPIQQEIFDWIDYHDRHVFEIYLPCGDIGEYCLDCLVWTSRGVIDYKETARALLALKVLRKMDYYNLACTYCLEDDIAVIMPNVLDVVRYIYDEETHGYGMDKMMVYFWSARLTRNFQRLSHYVGCHNEKYKTEYGINEFVFRVTACHKRHRNNPVAIKFMWNLLSEDEKLRQIPSVIRYGKTDIKCFLLSQMNEAQQQKIFRVRSREMLLSLLDDWFWKDYFLPTMHFVWNVIPALDFLLVLEDVVKCRMEKHHEDSCEYYRYKGIVKELWQSAPRQLREYVFKCPNGSRGSGIFFGLLCSGNIDGIQSILTDLNDVQRNNLIFPSYNNCSKCHWLIVNDQIDVVKKFINSTFFSVKELDVFKQNLVESHGCNVAVNLIQNHKWDVVEDFLKWAFKSDHDEKEFKAKLTFSKTCDDILESVVTQNDGGGLVELDNFFLWCASGSKQKVSEIKQEMYGVYFTRAHCRLIEEDKYQLLEEFLNWCFSNSTRDIELIKNCFYRQYECIQTIQLVLNLVEKNNQLQSLEKFVHWCFTSNTEIARFKRWILEPRKEGTEGVCMKLLCEGMFELAEELVHWCCDSSPTKIRLFKMKFLLYDNIEYLFKRLGQDEKMLGKVVKWFDPSTKEIVKFRKKFENFPWLTDRDLACHFIRNQKWDEVDRFVLWAFKSDDERVAFKEKLAESKICDDILESIVTSNSDEGFVQLEKLFSWCWGSGNTRKDFEFKRKTLRKRLYNEYFREEIFCRLIDDDKYPLLEHFLNWFYTNNGRQVEMIKRNFHRNFDYVQVVKLVLNLVEKNNRLQSLEKFVNWCFTRTAAIDGFKKWMLKPGKGDADGVCINLLRKDLFKLADEFVRWCCNMSSQLKVPESKKELMFSDRTVNLLTEFQEDRNKLERMVRWFKPSRKEKIQLAKKFKGLYWVVMVMKLLRQKHNPKRI